MLAEFLESQLNTPLSLLSAQDVISRVWLLRALDVLAKMGLGRREGGLWEYGCHLIRAMLGVCHSFCI